MYIFTFIAIPIVVLLGATNAETPQPPNTKRVAYYDDWIAPKENTPENSKPCKLLGVKYGYACSKEEDGKLSGILTLVDDENGSVDAMCNEITDKQYEQSLQDNCNAGYSGYEKIQAKITNENNKQVEVTVFLPNAAEGCPAGKPILPTVEYLRKVYCALVAAGLNNAAEKVKGIGTRDGKAISAC